MQIPPYNPEHINMFGLGCPRFARRYLGDRKNLLPGRNGAKHQTTRTSPVAMQCIRPERKFRILLSIPLGTEMFHFPRYASYIRKIPADDRRVSPFRHFRVKGYLAPHRNLSQPYHVFHRFLKPRHSPYTLCSCKEHCISQKGYAVFLALFAHSEMKMA